MGSVDDALGTHGFTLTSKAKIGNYLIWVVVAVLDLLLDLNFLTLFLGFLGLMFLRFNLLTGLVLMMLMIVLIVLVLVLLV